MDRQVKFIEKEFDHAWQAAKFVQEGGVLLIDNLSRHDEIEDCKATGQSMAIDWYESGKTLYTIQPSDWREQLDGTVVNGVLCRASGQGVYNSISLIVGTWKERGYGYIADDGSYWHDAEPLTKAEILMLAERAPE